MVASAKVYKDKLALILISSYIYSVFLFSYAEGKTFVPKIIGLIIFLYFFAQLAFGRLDINFKKEFMFLFLWLMFSFVSAAFAKDVGIAVAKVITLLQVYGLSFVIFSFYLALKKTDVFLFVFITATFLCVGLSWGDPAAYTLEGRYHATLGNSNLLALVTLVSMLSAMHFTLSGKRIITKIFGAISVPALFYIVLLTGSRKAFLGMFLLVTIFGGIKFLYYMKHDARKAFPILMVYFLVMVFGINYLVQSEHFGRIERIYRAFESGDKSLAGKSELGRLELYEKGFEVALNNPVFGVGLDNLRNVKSGILGGNVGTYSHSNYIEIMTSTGFVGFLLYFSIYITSFRNYNLVRRFTSKLNDKEKSEYHIALVLFICFVIYDFAMVSYYEKLSWLIFSFVISIPYILLDDIRYKNRLDEK